MTDRKESIERILRFGEAAIALVARSNVEQWMEHADLTMTQMRLLLAISHAGPAGATMSELRTQMGTASLSTITGLVDRLHEQQLVERHSDLTDRRVVRIILSEQGEQELRTMYQADQYWIAALASIPDDELAQIASSVERMQLAIEQWSASTGPIPAAGARRKSNGNKQV